MSFQNHEIQSIFNLSNECKFTEINLKIEFICVVKFTNRNFNLFTKYLFMQKLPHVIASYVRDHFHDGYLIGLNSTMDEYGQVSLKIQLTENEITHQLEFDKNGKLKKSESAYRFKKKNTDVSVCHDGMS